MNFHNTKVSQNLFLYPATKVWRGIMLYPSVSVRLSVRLSVRAHHFRSIT